MRMRRHKVLIVLSALLPVILLVGCETGAPSTQFPDLTYRHLGPITLDVARVEVATRYIPPLKAPNVEHRAPVAPYVAIRRWAGQRLKAGGLRKLANLIILDASIRELALPVKGGFEGFFTTQQSVRYDSRAAVLLEIRDAGDRQLAFVTARASRSVTVLEGASISQREKVWFALTEALILDINRQLEIQARRHLGAYLLDR
jgi:hypothetical protein